MTGTQVIERQITRRLMGYEPQGYEQQGDEQPEVGQWADRLIAVLAVTAGLLIAGSVFEELLWAVVGVATLVTLR